MLKMPAGDTPKRTLFKARRLYLYLLSSALILLILAAFFALLFSNARALRREEESLRLKAELAAEAYAADSTPAFSVDAEISLFPAAVIAQQDEPLSEELREAAESGEGAARRFDSDGELELYYAKRLPDGSIICVSAETADTRLIDSVAVFGIVVLVLIFVFLSLWAVRGQPQESLIDYISAVAGGDGAKRRRKTAQGKSSAAQGESKTEGIFMVDKAGTILLVNEKVKPLIRHISMGRPREPVERMLARPPLGAMVESALDGNRTDVIIQNFEKSINVCIYPTYEGSVIIGATGTLSDVTEEPEAVRLRQEFTATVSHELKTPLTSISGYAEMISSGMAADEDVKRFARKISDESARLLALINNVIQLSAFDEGSVSEMFEPCDLFAVARPVVEQMQPLAAEHSVDLSISGASVTVQGSPWLLSAMLKNLIENALRYNVRGGTAEVSVEMRYGSPTLTVSNTGVGIEHHHRARIFERFYRVEKSRSKETGGSGLGLAIVRHIVQYHSAQIEVESEPGVLTTIRVRFEGKVEEIK